MATGLSGAIEIRQTTNNPNRLPDVRLIKDVLSTSLTAKVAEASIDSASKAFERAKASRSYGIEHVYYGFLTLKEKLVRLNGKQQANLDLYRTHTALCAQIDKVKSVYKAYRTAQKAADNAPVEPAIQRKGARQKAQTAGKKLVEQYDQLIELAIEQAEDHEFSKKEKDYLDDIQSELSKDTEGHILKTVNQLRARKPVEGPIVDSKKHSTSMNKNYIEFVVDFVSQVHVANQKSGGREDLQGISKAFVEGLASIPELGDGLTLIELYGELNDKADDIQETQLQSTVDDFSKQLEILMNEEGDITDEELNSIHSHGVALSSVSSLTVADLNNLKIARKEHVAALEELTTAQNELAENQRVITNKADYSLNDIDAFFKETGKKVEDLPDETKNDGTAGGRLVKAMNNARKDIEALTKRLTKIQEEKIQQNKRDRDAITESHETLVKAKLEVMKCSHSIPDQEERLVKLKTEDSALEIQYKLDEHRVLNNDDSIPPLLRQGALELLKQNYQTEKDKIAAEINKLKKKIEETKKNEEVQKTILRREEAARPSLEEAAKRNAENALKTIGSIITEIAAKKTSTMISLSGAEVAEIGRALKVGDLSSKGSKMAVAYRKAITACDKVKKLDEETIPAYKKSIERQEAILLEGSLMTTQVSGAFVVSDKLFGKSDIRQGIEARISSNFDIAKGVTLAVAEEAVRQEDKYYKSQKQPKTKISARQQQVEDRVSPLQTELKARNLKSEPSVFEEIKKRVKVLPATVNPAPASIPGDTMMLNMGDSLDASSPGQDSSSTQTPGSAARSTQGEDTVLLDEVSSEDDTLVIEGEL